MLLVEKNMKHIRNLIELNNISEYFVYIWTYYFGPQSKTIGFVVENEPKCMAKFFIGQFTMVLRHPPNTSLENNFANDKGTHKLCSHIILSHPMIRLCVQKIRWLVVEELISHYFFSGWMLVMKGFSYLIENVCGKVEQLILMESNLDIEFWLESWKEHYMDKVRQILPEKNLLWLE